MPVKLPRPSRKLDPRGFYTEYVPSLWNALTGDIENATWRVRVGAVLTDGADTHRFFMEAHGTTLSVREGEADRPHITFVSDVPSYRIAMFDLLPRVVKSVERKLGSRSPAAGIDRYGAAVNPDALYGVPGIVEVHFTDDAGDEARVEIRVGTGVGPRAVLTASDADLWTLIESGGGLTQMLRSRAELGGDVGYLLQVAGLVEP